MNKLLENKIKEVLIFGSYKNKAKPGDDIDLLIIVEEKPSNEVENEISKLCLDFSWIGYGILISALIYPSEYLKYNSPFIQLIKKEKIEDKSSILKIIERAEKIVEVSKILFGNNYYEFTVLNAYYVMIHCAYVLLLLNKGITTKKFHQLYIYSMKTL